jgi:hypothetical protein
LKKGRPYLLLNCCANLHNERDFHLFLQPCPGITKTIFLTFCPNVPFESAGMP